MKKSRKIAIMHNTLRRQEIIFAEGKSYRPQTAYSMQ